MTDEFDDKLEVAERACGYWWWEYYAARGQAPPEPRSSNEAVDKSLEEAGERQAAVAELIEAAKEVAEETYTHNIDEYQCGPTEWTTTDKDNIERLRKALERIEGTDGK